MSDIFELSDMKPTFIFVDGSYYCLYRYYSLMNWWKNAHPDEPLEDPFLNELFLEKFRKTFVENLKSIPKKLKISKNITPIMIVGKDCKRNEIWRNELFPEYKGTRVEDGFMGSPFFKMAYEEKLFQEGGASAVLKHPKLEADDCIALSIKLLRNRYPECTIYVITSDKDYLQLNESNVHLFNMGFKNIAENKSSTGDPVRDLKIKILMGDTSDNIPSVFPKCGQKTAEKCIDDEEFFKKKMGSNESYFKQYELNERLVNFDFIPQNLVDEFMLSLKNY
jgi:5'-3' exonuclease